MKNYQVAEALSNILTGGNHLASSLLQICPPSSIKNYEEALAAHGQPYADMWIAWHFIMQARPYLAAEYRSPIVKDLDLTEEQKALLLKPRKVIVIEKYMPKNKKEFSAMLMEEYGYNKNLSDLIADDVAGYGAFDEKQPAKGVKP